ncbi:hypothetical protein QE441_003172 [Chryseobacterium sp. SORGH_AS909]|uniref:Transposase n=1 Tax=Chryseobacterium camelliae TaxID=1265445 RepID=A0ABU0TGB5_9FLAO|nr:hypothetical protein [Chryseobacterium camelliae]MDQ1100034.1 hypothetical protein [Chryseobacterium sp. SORGH_AS_1048]MDR6087378.1 hypothetical protein [Chryseobacterium sp. SORGH_AS_0909]MDR6131753.1 hypothetical protein [Chryseobacterium sp. SORGH_AS_1175]MDT3406100.1 hypothetical protein [Pseudacidovorax intermedius]
MYELNVKIMLKFNNEIVLKSKKYLCGLNLKNTISY